MHRHICVLQGEAKPTSCEDGETVDFPIRGVDFDGEKETGADGEDRGAEDDEWGVIPPPGDDAAGDEAQDHQGQHEGE